MGSSLSKLGTALLLLGLFAIGDFAQESTCDLKVNVFAVEANAPIERAKVKLSSLESNQIVSPSFIENRFNGVNSGKYKVEIVKEGYGGRVKEFKVECNFANRDGVIYQSVYLPARNDPNAPPKTDAKGLIAGVALYLEKPEYPVALRGKEKLTHHIEVRVVIDEDGNVLTVEAVNDNSLFGTAAVKAAMGAKFEPTRLSSVAVKVMGSIAYDFVP